MFFARTPETPPRGNPLSGTWESMPEARKRFLLASETKVRTLLAESGPRVAVELIGALALDADETAALWMLFDSTERRRMREAWK